MDSDPGGEISILKQMKVENKTHSKKWTFQELEFRLITTSLVEFTYPGQPPKIPYMSHNGSSSS